MQRSTITAPNVGSKSLVKAPGGSGGANLSSMLDNQDASQYNMRQGFSNDLIYMGGQNNMLPSTGSLG